MVKEAGARLVLHYLAPRTSKPGTGSSGESAGTVLSQAADLDGAGKAHEMVTDAGILWTMKIVTCHYSCRLSLQAGDRFKRMVPGSKVVKSFLYGGLCLRDVLQTSSIFSVIPAARD